MIAGVGVDLVDIARIEKIYSRYGEKFASRVLSPRELLESEGKPLSYLAGRFAAREACVKALGVGFRGGIDCQSMEILNDPGGKPAIKLLAKAREAAERLGAKRVHLSISHERNFAVAMVILES